MTPFHAFFFSALVAFFLDGEEGPSRGSDDEYGGVPGSRALEAARAFVVEAQGYESSTRTTVFGPFPVDPISWTGEITGSGDAWLVHVKDLGALSSVMLAARQTTAADVDVKVAATANPGEYVFVFSQRS